MELPPLMNDNAVSFTKDIYAMFNEDKQVLNNWYNLVCYHSFDSVVLNKLFEIFKSYLLLRERNKIHSQMKYIFKSKYEDTNMYHPIFHIDCVGIKLLLKYLEHTEDMERIKTIDRDKFYHYLCETEPTTTQRLPTKTCDIYKTIEYYKEIMKIWFDTQYKVGNKLIKLKDLYDLTDEWKQYLIPHSTKQNYFSTRHNYKIEQSIMNQITHILETKLETKVVGFPPHTREGLRDGVLYSKPSFGDTPSFGVGDTPLFDTLRIHELEPFTFTELQLKVINNCMNNRISIVQGGGGCGKTTISIEIAKRLIANRQSVIFLTISHKAKGVIQDRLIHEGVRATTSTIASFRFSPQKNYDNIIIDETSMVGNDFLSHILSQVKHRLIMIGDTKQVLPVCVNGTPFIALQSVIPTNYLTASHRCGNELRPFIEAVSQNMSYCLQEYDNQETGVYYSEKDFTELFCYFWNKYDKKEVADKFAGIKPTKVEEYNLDIQKALCVGKKELIRGKLYEDDYVVRTSNIEDKVKKIKFYNGTFGFVKSYTTTELKINYIDGKEEVIDKRLFFSNFSLGYIQTTHKYQGSECDIVLFNLKDNYSLYNRKLNGRKNLLYTSITRPRKLLIICGDETDPRSNRELLHELTQSEFFKPIHSLKNQGS